MARSARPGFTTLEGFNNFEFLVPPRVIQGRAAPAVAWAWVDPLVEQETDNIQVPFGRRQMEGRSEIVVGAFQTHTSSNKLADVIDVPEACRPDQFVL